MDDDELGQALADMQAEYARVTADVRQRRRDLVALARQQGKSKYWIAAKMGVKGPTVDSIIGTAERDEP